MSLTNVNKNIFLYIDIIVILDVVILLTKPYKKYLFTFNYFYC